MIVESRIDGMRADRENGVPGSAKGLAVGGPYSVLRASTGLMDAARRAGIIAATAAQIPSVIIAAGD
jgi:hypothetical protein